MCHRWMPVMSIIVRPSKFYNFVFIGKAQKKLLKFFGEKRKVLNLMVDNSQNCLQQVQICGLDSVRSSVVFLCVWCLGPPIMSPSHLKMGTTLLCAILSILTQIISTTAVTVCIRLMPFLQLLIGLTSSTILFFLAKSEKLLLQCLFWSQPKIAMFNS